MVIFLAGCLLECLNLVALQRNIIVWLWVLVKTQHKKRMTVFSLMASLRESLKPHPPWILSPKVGQTVEKLFCKNSRGWSLR